MKLTTVNAKKQGPTGETEESVLRPSDGQTGSDAGQKSAFGKAKVPLGAAIYAG